MSCFEQNVILKALPEESRPHSSSVPLGFVLMRSFGSLAFAQDDRPLPCAEHTQCHSEQSEESMHQ